MADAVIYDCIVDPVKATFDVQSFSNATLKVR